MHPDGGEAAAAPQENTKRMRRPSVRLHQPYYENPGHRKMQQQWNPKKCATPPRKPRTAKTAHSKYVNKDAVNDRRCKGEGAGHFDCDDDVVIGNWRNFSATNRDIDFKRKRVRSSNSKNARSRRNGDQEIGNNPLSSGGESGKQEHEENEVEEEEDLGGDVGINSNLVVEDSNPSSPNHSFGDDDNGDHKLSDDNNNVGGNQVRKQRSLRDNRDSNEMQRELMTPEGERDSSGVRMWLNDLGFGKFAALFQIHGVDDEVLPLLTLEDLKDMGINEVGVRRKMYSSIQKLHRWFT